MYNGGRNGIATSAYDSKYTVADILSTMANGEPVTPSFANQPFITGIPTGTTPTLTPTTLANLEQTFIELQSVPTTTAGRNQSGFVPPVIYPPSESQDSSYDSFSDEEWIPDSGAKRQRISNRSNIGVVSSTTPRRTPGARRKEYAKSTPEEEERRRVRRERNKIAAAKCRQRRVDLTNKLIDENEKLEEERASIEAEIQSLQQQKDQLQFLLQAHKPLCQMKKQPQNKNVVIKTEKEDSYIPSSESSVPVMVSCVTTRPTSLPIRYPTLAKSCAVSEALGVPITTPSNGVFSFNLDTMMDHTGLTPITGPSCASQIHRTNSDSSPDAIMTPSKLMAL